MQAACDSIGGCPTGGAVITPGFGLSSSVAYPVGIIIAVFAFAIYITQLQQWRMAPEELKENWRFVDTHKRIKDAHEE